MDAAFLHQEGDRTHMHIGGVALFQGPPPAFEEVLEHVRSRLHLVPRYRQRIAAAPLGLGRQRWLDEPASTSPTTSGTPRCPSRATASACSR